MKLKHSLIALSVLACSVASAEVVKGIDTTTGYAANYASTGQEMILDFSSVSWNVINVSSSKQLSKALSKASPGDKIVLAPGTYSGRFKLSKSGSQNKPIWVVGADAANMPIIDGGDYNNKTAFAVDGNDKGISYIYVQNIKVTNARGGISVDNADYITIDGVEAYNVGQAGIHLRDGSEYNIIKNSYIYNTGLYNVKYGEGIYIGSDYRKWPGGSSSSEYNPKVDHAQIINNIIGPNVTAEHIDIKEGSSYAYIIGNTFDAKGMIDILNGGLSYIDFKGNNAEAAYNTGNQNGNEYFENAFEVNTKSEGWGFHNNIHNNVLNFDDEFAGKKSITMTLALGSKGKAKSSKQTKEKSLDHWVVRNNTKGTTKVSNNTRVPADSKRMYKGDISEY
ncbi:hypothetical protein OFY17_01775 [Marinomonas sp. C2222]|uniref:Right handed beta helix domain-containing protein n=1 Tax=Marinomonas sargassi TaxID=2984494 RepID=A0ABT2YNY6_9GAMM|nr:hypothetical protein [Marinomonas sargassi]MCV2401601.1 hypothetical protein [Marinomonas sargassi]